MGAGIDYPNNKSKAGGNLFRSLVSYHKAIRAVSRRIWAFMLSRRGTAWVYAAGLADGKSTDTGCLVVYQRRNLIRW